MIHTFINLYIVDENNNPVIGEPLPSKLSSVHKGAHFMTLDKVVAEMHMSDAQMDGQYFGGDPESGADPSNKAIGKNQKIVISDFDEYMP